MKRILLLISSILILFSINGQEIKQTIVYSKDSVSFASNIMSAEISGDGNTLAISTIGLDTIGSFGYIKIFKYHNDDWLQNGKTLSGTEGGQLLGSGLSLNHLGNKIALGSTFDLSLIHI